ncbi:hypothetical protein [Alteribacter natronophilus]|nr:hypothetical protein [Alteribacter natronophilus]
MGDDVTFFNGYGLDKVDFSKAEKGKTVLVKPETNGATALKYPFFPYMK